MNVVVVPGNDNLLVRTVVMRCAGINDTVIVSGDDALIFAPPTHPAATATMMMMVVVMVVMVVRRADIVICTADVYK